MDNNTTHIFSRVAAIMAIAILFSTCDKMPMNGDLDGMWQLMNIETPAQKLDVKQRRVYVSVQLHLTMWENKILGDTYYAHFEHRGDSIRFYDFVHNSLHQNKSQDDELITAQEMSDGLLDDWGVHSLDARYRIDHLSDSRLILHSNDTILTFRKI